MVATAVHFLKQSVIGLRYPAAFIVLMPMLVTGANAGSALPLGSAINVSTDPNFVNLMALGSMALSVLYVWLGGTLVTVPARVRAFRAASVAAE